MQQENSKIKSIVFTILYTIPTICFTLLFMVLLGSFYVAINHSIGLNLLIWISIPFIAYYITYIFRILVNKIFKKRFVVKNFDGWSILASLIVVTIICLFSSMAIDDYLYVEVMGLISGIVATFQIVYSVFQINHKKQ